MKTLIYKWNHIDWLREVKDIDYFAIIITEILIGVIIALII